MFPWTFHLKAVLQLQRCSAPHSAFCACVCRCMPLPVTVCGFFCIWWEYSGYPCMPKTWEKEVGVVCIQRAGKPRGASSVYSSGKWTGLDINCLPMRSWAKPNGTDGKRKRVAAYFYSVHLLPQPFLPFPLLPSTASPQYKNADTWISGPLCMWSTPSQHNERLSSQRYGKYFFQIFRRLINCWKLGEDAVISHMSYPPCSFVSLIYFKRYNTWTSITSLQGYL